MRVFKYELPITDNTSILLFRGAEILHVATQQEKIFVWALVDEYATAKTVKLFRIAGTGHEIVDVSKWKYLGTVHMRDGSVVRHVFYDRTTN